MTIAFGLQYGGGFLEIQCSADRAFAEAKAITLRGLFRDVAIYKRVPGFFDRLRLTSNPARWQCVGVYVDGEWHTTPAGGYEWGALEQ